MLHNMPQQRYSILYYTMVIGRIIGDKTVAKLGLKKLWFSTVPLTVGMI